MKKLIPIILILTLLPTMAWATPPGFSGAINNEYTYEEVVFITGEPIKFVGTFSTTVREREDEKTITYKISKMTPEDKSIDATLKKTVRYVTEYTKWNDQGQTTAQTYLDSARETLNIGEDRYELEDYQFSKSDVIDNRPASDFYSGNLQGRKLYSINKDEGTVTIDISGGNAGYENFWGNTETQILDYMITYDRSETEETPEAHWQGTVNIQTSDSQTKTLKYSDNNADYSSFHGGYIRATNREMVSKYEYNMPRVYDDGEVNDDRRDRGRIQLNLEMVPKLERLIVPKFRDIRGHWAENVIEKLYSLDVFDEETTFFAPDIPFTRLEFAKAIVKASDMRTSLGEEDNRTTSRRRRRNEPPEVSPFNDVSVDDGGYKYIKAAVDKGIISGVGNGSFQPNGPLTKAEAITILIKALGFESKAPNPGYFTSFADDSKIPSWAKDSIYMARELNLITGDDFNRVNPDKIVTRADASSMLVRFLEFLEKDLQKDYRENIINFR